MASNTLFILATIFASCTSYVLTPTYPFDFVGRSDWGARPSGPVSMLENVASHVVIHHTYQPGVCMTLEACKAAMRGMQVFHQDGNGWVDIGYNFAIGGEGRVYEGRGWEVVGAHAVGYNSKSVGIALIGDWRTDIPPVATLKAAKVLIEEGVRRGYISSKYILMGHRQASATECPGEALFNEIAMWPRFRTE